MASGGRPTIEGVIQWLSELVKLTRALSHDAEYENSVALSVRRSASVHSSQNAGHLRWVVCEHGSRIRRAVSALRQVAASDRVAQRALDTQRTLARLQGVPSGV